jgi:cell division protein FtsX
MSPTPQPPAWADRLLAWFCAPHLLEEVQGDLHERFCRRAAPFGIAYARRQYVREVLGFLRPAFLKQTSKPRLHANAATMLHSYLTTALRSFSRNKVYAFLNVAGLCLGIATFLVIFLIVRNELGYDNFHRKADRTYRVTLMDHNANVSLGVSPPMRTDFPEFEQLSQVYYRREGLVKAGPNRYNEKDFTFADGRFFQIFDYQWLAGNPKTALAEPNTVVLTQSIARKYFGRWDVLGETVQLNNQHTLRVTGVIADVPGNTHLPFGFAVSWETVRKEFEGYGNNFWSIPGDSYVYVVLPERYPVERVARSIPAFVAKHWQHEVKGEALVLQPLLDIHFDQRFFNNITRPAGRSTYWALSGIAVFIVVAACINFINLATVQSVKRAREVGVRKVLGASRSQLVGQFLGETAMLVIVALVVGLGLAVLALPHVAAWMDIRVDAGQLAQPGVMAVTALVTVAVILLAGLYPSFVQSAFRPVESLKSRPRVSLGGVSLRKSLVVVQFALSQVLLLGTLVVARQMDFFRNQELGFVKEAVVTFGVPDKAKREVLAQQLAAAPGVQAVTFSSGAPIHTYSATSLSAPDLGITKEQVTQLKFVDEHYLDMFGLKLLAGRKLAKVSEKDTIGRVVVNRTLLRQLGIKTPGEALGKRIMVNGNPHTYIIGVVEDFQVGSKHGPLSPCVLQYRPDAFFMASAKIHPGQLRETIGRIDQTWSALFPDHLFAYKFIDDHIADLYRQEQKVYTAFQIFCAIALVIGCLGLYGLVSFMAVQRTKEVGVRKVLGASVGHILLLFTREYMGLVLISFVVAAPVGLYFANQWLSGFAYRIALSPSLCLLAVGFTLTIALLTVSYQSLRAALANPANSLRSE